MPAAHTFALTGSRRKGANAQIQSMKTLVSTLSFVALLGASAIAGQKIPDSHKIAGFALGSQAYTFNRFTVFEAIEKTDQAGGKVIEFFPGQALSPDERTVKWSHNSPEDVVEKVKAKLEKHKILPVNYGVVGGKDEAEWRKIFEFAKKLNLYGITTEDVAQLDIIEKLVKEFDIRVAYHEHKRQPDNPKYEVWDPNFVAKLVAHRDPRIGACADTGH